VSDELADRPLTEPHTTRLRLDDPNRAVILALHDEAMRTGADGYADPKTGFFVQTAESLRARGSCCDCGCRHCPYL
jgi:hypothetical protein